jgi:hypothetical protein
VNDKESQCSSTSIVILQCERKPFYARGIDPGRTFPEVSTSGSIGPCGLADTPPLKLIDEFDYIPVRGGAFHVHIHNQTPQDPYIFLFDNVDNRPCPLSHFRASHIALMVEAQPHLSNVTRLRSPKGDAAESEITTLVRLYQGLLYPFQRVFVLSWSSQTLNQVHAY